MDDRTDRIMERMGFPADARGRYVDELRTLIRRQVGAGLVNRSAGTWGPGSEALSVEDRAKALLAFDWAVSRHSCRIEVADGLIGWRLDPLTRKRGLRIRWRRFPAWLGDRWRSGLMNFRVWSDRALGIVNPYT